MEFSFHTIFPLSYICDRVSKNSIDRVNGAW